MKGPLKAPPPSGADRPGAYSPWPPVPPTPTPEPTPTLPTTPPLAPFPPPRLSGRKAAAPPKIPWPATDAAGPNAGEPAAAPRKGGRPGSAGRPYAPRRSRPVPADGVGGRPPALASASRPDGRANGRPAEATGASFHRAGRPPPAAAEPAAAAPPPVGANGSAVGAAAVGRQAIPNAPGRRVSMEAFRRQWRQPPRRKGAPEERRTKRRTTRHATTVGVGGASRVGPRESIRRRGCTCPRGGGVKAARKSAVRRKKGQVRPSNAPTGATITANTPVGHLAGGSPPSWRRPICTNTVTVQRRDRCKRRTRHP